MYGIRDHASILCKSPGGGFVMIYEPTIKRFTHVVPVIVESQNVIDRIMQEATVFFNKYDLVVFKFSEEDSVEYTFRKLRGH